MATLFQAPTIEQLANLLRDKSFTAPWRALQIIQPQGTRLPFFFVGDSGRAHALAPFLGTNQPVYGLHIFSLLPSNGPIPSLEIKEIAKQFIQEIQTVQTEGPYCLGAFCGDFNLALEMAQQFQLQGQKVPYQCR